jgi:hypothetical protein
MDGNGNHQVKQHQPEWEIEILQVLTQRWNLYLRKKWGEFKMGELFACGKQ